MLEACLEVDPSPEQVAVVRAFVRATLAEWELTGLVDAAQLVASELATNAMLHARTPFRVTVRSAGMATVRVEVTDDNPRLPIRPPEEEGATSGRGLQVVALVSSAWGTETDGLGKTVWADLGVLETSDDPECLDLRNVQSADEALDRIDGRRSDPSNA